MLLFAACPSLGHVQACTASKTVTPNNTWKIYTSHPYAAATAATTVAQPDSDAAATASEEPAAAAARTPVQSDPIHHHNRKSPPHQLVPQQRLQTIDFRAKCLSFSEILLFLWAVVLAATSE